MKRKINSIFLFITVLVFSLNSCDDFLDEMPDNRAELNSYQKLQNLLVSAYSNVDPMMIYDHRTDNVVDNGSSWGNPNIMLIENYFWKESSGTDWDNPEMVWQQNYKAISAANHALKVYKELGEDSGYAYIKGEALITRGYHHFVLANTFCQPYAESIAESEMGIPYADFPETEVGTTYERGLLKEVYEKIANDIETGYPMLNDDSYRVPLYHFTKKSAAAFAARFYLFYGKYELAVKYANLAIGENTSIDILRDFTELDKSVSSSDWHLVYIRTDQPSNLICFALRSLWGRNYRSARYANNTDLTSYVTYRSTFPGGRLGAYDLVWGFTGDPAKWLPKYYEIFEITNVIAQTGQPHVVYPAFTTDETLLCRAEARVMLKQYDKAAEDLSLYYVSKRGKAASTDDIVKFYTDKQAQEQELIQNNTLAPWHVLVKPLDPKFPLESGTQEKMIQAALHARRVETMHSGLRWLDIRRYGIEVIHPVDQGEPITLTAHDLRKVIQIPQASVLEGIPANPR